MGLSSLFRFRKVANEAILELLESVTLGTNGAHYKHQDTSKRIGLIDNPLFLTIERNEKVIANVTFCVRNQDWYVRYFAFNTGLQSSGKKKSNGSSLIKNELKGFFQSTLLDGFEGEKVNSFYAYIDPNNEKSLWMSENFGFQYYRTVATQSFSRISPKVKSGVRMIDFNNDFVPDNYLEYMEELDEVEIADEAEEILKFPLTSVDVPIVVPLTNTETPGTPEPSSEAVTRPETDRS